MYSTKIFILYAIFSLSKSSLTCSQPNILVDDQGNAQIVDFGPVEQLSTYGSDGASVVLGYWQAPEILSEERGDFTKSADVYSFSITALEVSGLVSFCISL